jgi:hypothetical protein
MVRFKLPVKNVHYAQKAVKKLLPNNNKVNLFMSNCKFVNILLAFFFKILELT